MSIISSVADGFKSLFATVDNLHTSDKERLDVQAQMLEIQTQVFSELISYEKQLADAQSKIILAEANGNDWLQKNWRPLAMITFVVLIVLDFLGFGAHRLSEHAWELMKIGMGGYVVGRSVEKVATAVGVKPGFVGRAVGKVLGKAK
ncbi:MAG: 3TM-type holin [Cellvibrionales bacterium]|nr:3TM-type holin [Cellvibrionales bacterium]